MKGIIFTAPMVRAILEGRKTVTRRVIKRQPVSGFDELFLREKLVGSPYRPGEVVYVKETWAQIWNQDGCLHDESDFNCPCKGCHIEYKADTGAKYPADWPDDSTGDPCCPKWRSPRFMPEWAARSHALIKSVRPERVQEISHEDALAEGIDSWIATLKDPSSELREQRLSVKQLAFSRLWDTLHPGSWERNDWVWRVKFKVTP